MTIKELKNHCVKTLEMDKVLRSSRADVTGTKVKEEHELILSLIKFYEDSKSEIKASQSDVLYPIDESEEGE